MILPLLGIGTVISGFAATKSSESRISISYYEHC